MSNPAQGMHQFRELIEDRLSACGSPILIAAPMPLEVSLIEKTLDDGRVAGIIAGLAPAPVVARHRCRVGYWSAADYSSWELPAERTSELIFLGAARGVSLAMLLAARKHGVKVLCTVAPGGDSFERHRIGRMIATRLRTVLTYRTKAFRDRARARLPILATFLDHFSYDYSTTFRATCDRLRPLFGLPAAAFDPRRVLMIVDTLGPGGAQRQLSLTAAGVKEVGKFDVGVCCHDLQPPTNDFFRAGLVEAGIAAQELPTFAPEFAMKEVGAFLDEVRSKGPVDCDLFLEKTIAIASHIRRERPALVHTWLDSTNVLAGLAAQIVGVPALICSGRSLAPDHFAFHHAYMRPGYQALLQHPSTTLLNNSEAGARDYERWLGLQAGDVQVLYNGFDFPDLAPTEAVAATKARLHIDAAAPVIGSILRFSEEKQPQLMIDAAAEIARSRPDAAFVFFGDGPMLEPLRRQVDQRSLAKWIRLPGYTQNAWESLAIMDLFLLTSRVEGLPNVLIEAQAMGVPVVTTPAGGAGEAFVDGVTGWAIGEFKADVIAGICLQALRDTSKRRQTALAARNFARSHFGRERMIDKTLAIYRRAMGASGRTATAHQEQEEA